MENIKESKFVEIDYLDIDENEQYEKTIELVVNECFKVEKLENTNLYMCITLTNPEHIHKLNKEYRTVDRPTDVLSFPMFEKDEVERLVQKYQNNKRDIREVLGDVVISIEKVEEQAKEYGHSFERELAYMVVHGFYHIMGYDHIKEEDKVIMRPKEEYVLNKLKIIR